MLRSAILGMLLVLTGCVGPTGPVFGDWSGRPPNAGGDYSSYVDLVLHGAPGDSAGAYEFQATTLAPTATDVEDRYLTWGDRWTLSGGVGAGSARILELHNLPPSQISRYALLPNGVLVPLKRGGQPDLSAYSLGYALAPVPRTRWGYGRI